ncbi:MAG: hypothetical protein L6V83_05880 [Christensenella sp.]|nr:MAG: hypothetical protein L6V83_05880 [Christensenella sp.]
MEFFEKAFNWLAELSSKMPAIDFKTYFIVVVAVIVGIGVIVALTYFGSRARKLIGASKKIEKYLANVDQVDDDNVSDFTAHCFSSKAPQPLRDSWVQYLGVRFGYPSDVVSDGNVYEKVVKKNKDYRSGIYLAIALLVLGFFAFWGFGTLTANEMGVIHFVGLVAIAVVFLVLIIINRKQSKKCLEVFEDMQEDLDAKVNLQVESNYATDSSPLAELSGMVEEIIARNTAKAVDAEQEYALEQTPIEALIEEKTEEEKSAQIEEESATETLDEEDGTVEQTIDELIASEPQGADEEPVQVEEQADEQTDEVADEEPVEDTDETVEEEPVQDEETEETEEVEEPVIDEQVEEEPVAEESVEEPAEESEPVEDTETEAVEETVEESEEQESEESPVEESTEEVKEQETESVDEATDDSESEQEEIAEDEDVKTAETEDPVDDVENEDAEETDENEDGEETQAEDEEPEVVYVVDGDEDDDEHVKPAKLVKLPNLVDYMLSKNMPRAMKIQIATMLIGTYKKFENSKEDRKIVVGCLAKVMRDLQENK